MTESDLQFRSLAGAMPVRVATATEAQWISAAQAFAAAGAGSSQCGARTAAMSMLSVKVSSCMRPMQRTMGWPACACLSPMSQPLSTRPFRRSIRLPYACSAQCSICSAYARATRATSALGYVTPLGRLIFFRCDVIPNERPPSSARQEQYPFVTVAGDGVHEIPVGPIHAGIIEPGHFRFSIVGEKVLRLEERLGYVHKGIDKLFDGMPLSEGHRLAGRVSGDSTVAYAWAYAMAVESVTRCVVPPRTEWLRALLLERERVANHLGDLGALGNDAGLAFGLAQFSRLREQWLRVNFDSFGHRLLMDCIVPGGVAIDVDASALARIRQQCSDIGNEVLQLRAIYDEHAGLQDRFQTAGVVTPELAARLGLCGLAGRASGQKRDLRVDFPRPPYDQLQVRLAFDVRGDVAARVGVRFDELIESLRLIRLILDELPESDVRVSLPPVTDSFGVGWVEGWRGEVMVALEADAADAAMDQPCPALPLPRSVLAELAAAGACGARQHRSRLSSDQ